MIAGFRYDEFCAGPPAALALTLVSLSSYQAFAIDVFARVDLLSTTQWLIALHNLCRWFRHYTLSLIGHQLVDRQAREVSGLSTLIIVNVECDHAARFPFRTFKEPTQHKMLDFRPILKQLQVI